MDRNLIVKSYEVDATSNFAAAAVLLDRNGTAYHAGIIIKFDNEYNLFHYTGERVEIIPVPPYEQYTWYYHKDFIIIDEELVESFYAHCLMVNECADPKYGYLFPDSFYKDDAFSSEGDIPEYMTCVGFCLNVIQGFEPKRKYIDYSDWDFSMIPDQDKWVNKFLEDFKVRHPHFSNEDIIKHLKRVAPDEYLTSSFFAATPINKKNIDLYIDDVRKELKERMIPNQATSQAV